MFYLSELWRYLKRAKVSSVLILTVLTMSSLMLIVSSSLLIFSDRIEAEIYNTFSIQLFLKNVNSSELGSFKKNLLLDNKIAKMEFTGKNDAEAKFLNETGIDFKSVLDINPLPEMFTLKIKKQFVLSRNFADLKKEYKKYRLVDDVILLNDDLVTSFEKINSMKPLIFILTFGITFISLGFLYLLNKNLILRRRNDFSIMKLVGAKRRILIIPLFLYNLLIGFVNAAVVIGFTKIMFILLNKLGFGITFDVLNTIHYLLIFSSGGILPMILFLFPKEFSTEILLEY